MDLSWDAARTWQRPDLRQDGIQLVRHGEDSLVLTNGHTLNISTDGGQSWTADPVLKRARDIAELRGGLYVLHQGDTLFYREDGGTEWEFVCAADRGRAIGGDDYVLFLLENGAIRRSTDGGKTWARIPVDVVRYYDPKIVPLDNGNAFAVTGIRDAILLSMDLGLTWKRLVPDPDKSLYVYCAYTDSKGRLLLGTDDGLYRSSTSLRSSTLVYTFQLGVPYPNPALSDVTIPCTLEQDGYVRLTLHDISGRERWILHEGYHDAGTHFFGLDNTYSSIFGGAGLYFISLSVNGEVQTQPLVFPH